MVRLFLSAALLVPTIAAVAVAQPANPDLAQAAAMYRSAEQAMAQSRYDDAARDYGAAYEISKDAVLFFKIGSALDKAGRCPVAMTYYRRYLREGKPSADFLRLTTERIAACEAAASGAAKPESEPGTTESTPSPSEAGGATTPTTPEPGPTTPEPGPEAADPGSSAEPERDPAAPPEAPKAATASDEDTAPPTSPRRTAAWIAVGGGIAFATAGAVFALSAESTEDDIADLYLVRPGGTPLPFDAATQKRYQDLVDRGDRYQLLSWTSFGLAGAAALTATYFFLTASPETSANQLAIHPVVAPHSAGVGASWRW